MQKFARIYVKIKVTSEIWNCVSRKIVATFSTPQLTQM